MTGMSTFIIIYYMERLERALFQNMDFGFWILVWTWKKDVKFIEENTRIIVGHMRDIVTCKSGPALSYVRCCFTNFFFFKIDSLDLPHFLASKNTGRAWIGGKYWIPKSAQTILSF